MAPAWRLANWNRLRIAVAWTVIKLVFYPYRVVERVLGRQLLTDHYYIMRVFRGLFRTFPVVVSGSHGLLPNGRTVVFSLDLCENTQQRFFRLGGQYESEWLQLAALGLRHAESFCDVGAHVGFYTVPLALAFPEKSILAFEPFEPNYARLLENISLNGLRNVEAYHAAVAERERTSTVEFFVNPIHDGGGSLIMPDVYQTGNIAIGARRYQKAHPGFVAVRQVRVIPLDEVITRSTVLKVDAEGGEVLVARSARRSMGSGLVKLAIVEVLNENLDEMLRLLEASGFDCFSPVTGSRMKLGDRFSYWAGNNVVCLRRDTEFYDQAVEYIRSVTADRDSVCAKR